MTATLSAPALNHSTLAGHILITGYAGSGKTYLIKHLITEASVRGHQIHVIDSYRAGADYRDLTPLVDSLSTDLRSAATQVEAIYEEIVRRKATLRRLAYSAVDAAPADVRAEERLGPITVVLDDYAALVEQTRIPVGLSQDDPLRDEIVDENAAKATIELLVSRIAREGRFAGVRVVLAMIRPDVSSLDSETRENIDTRIACFARRQDAVSAWGLTMTFDLEAAKRAVELHAEHFDGSPGLGVIQDHTGTVRAFHF